VTPAVPGAPLTWNVAALLAEGPGSVRDYDVAGATIDLGDDELRLADPIEGHVHLTRTNRGLLVNANLSTSIEAECSRCLKEIEVPLSLRIEEEALPSIDLQTGLPVDASVEPDALRLTDHHELELEAVVRDAVALAEPIAPLCDEACPGLCAVCGEQLAGAPHDHAEDAIDPRLEALRAFRVDGEGETE
jgi:uncharacterized protein